MKQKKNTKKQFGSKVGSLSTRWKEKPAEEQLFLLSCAQESLKDAIYITDRNHNIIYANPAVERVQGYKPEEVMGEKALRFFEDIPGNPPDLAGIIKREAKNGFWIGEVLNRRKDGSIFPVQLIENTIYGEKGKVLGYIGISRDISERKQLEEDLRNERDRFENLIQAIPDVVYFKDLKGQYLLANKAFLKFVRRKKEEIEGKKDSDLLPPGLARQCRRSDLLTLKSSHSIRVEENHVSKDGRITSFDTIKTLISDFQGRKIGLLGISRDITAAKHDKVALAESEERYRTIFEQAADSIVLIDARTGVLADFNDRAHENLGYTREEFGKMKIPDFEVIESAEEVSKHIEKIIKKGHDVFETKHKTKGGEIRDILVSTRTISVRGRDFIQAIWRDITERKQAEERLREASKLEAVGTLSLSIAHEFNNILMGISGYAQLALADLDDRQMTRKAFGAILRQSAKSRTLVGRLGTFGRREEPHPEPVDLTKILDEVVALQERELNQAGVRIKRSYTQPSLVLADYSQMEQVFFNLILNARQAIIPKKKGAITLSVQDKGKMVEARVIDNGIGIEAKELPEIFLPFYTTKAKQKLDRVPSLGLGLWVSKQIVEEQGGEIKVESQCGQGTTFIITLPRAEAASAGLKKEKAGKTSAPELRGQKVLVVDDEPELVEIYEEYLTSRGVEVAKALNGEEAIHLCRKQKFDTIILDYVMSGLEGKQLVEKIKKTAPASQIFIVSGKPIPQEEKEELSHSITGWLNKPVELKDLSSLLKR